MLRCKGSINARALSCFFLPLVIFLLASCRRVGGRTPDFVSEEELESINTVTIIGSPATGRPGQQISVTNDENLLFVLFTSDAPSQILNRKAYTTSYNCDTRNPNWVAWHLTAEHVDGEIPRDNNYYEDEEVPLPRATNEDYKGSGWSHGHMCPAADNKWSEQAMRESCLLTNICPQHASLNSGVWNVIERDCRKWAEQYGDLYIVCGPVYLNREHETIGENKIVVPEAFFKVILRMNPQPAAIGYVVRNNEGKKKRDQFINTVDDVERIAGYDFFSALPDEIENEVERTANLDDWR